MIRFENVSKKFILNNSLTNVIDNITFNIESKEIFGLVGETGSGKSTVLRMINGFIEPDSGEIHLMNQLLNHSSRKDLVKETSMLFQSFNLLGNINVLDNVLLPVKLRRRLGPSDYEKARDLLKYVGLSNYEKAYIKTLSGGQKQRVAIARTLITNPKIILCDEPTSALDEQMSYEVLKLLKDINKSFDTTIVIVSHDIGVIRATCNRVAVLENGRIMDIIPLKPEKMVPISYKEAFISD